MIYQRLAGAETGCRFTVGRDTAGKWIVSDARHLVGGIFVDRSTALHFAMAECDYDKTKIDAAPEGTLLTLDDMLARDEAGSPARR